ncbi:hypothetical protein HYU13_03940 [Candidatus Woesearchaeota archaeon]|nr:hypothetical protein [Candidatus Woesearchaeota archaeon]
MEKLLKQVRREDWQEFKAEAALHNERLGEFLTRLVKEHKLKEKLPNAGWDYILKGKSTLSEHDAEKIKESLALFERETGFDG